jgi:Arc/MetJ family transcription regulator
MSRFAVSTRTSAVCTAVRGPSVYATTAVKPRIREIGVWNTTATAVAVAIARASAAGTQGAGLTEVCLDDDVHVAIATAFNTHTADATVGAPIRSAVLAAAIGSGVIWTFGGDGLVLDNATTAGIVIICPTGTGQHLDFHLEWQE